MRRRVSGFALTGVLALVVLVVAHDLVFLLTFGTAYGFALARTGHDGRWDLAVRVVLGGGTALAAAAALRLGFLYGLVRAASSGSHGGLPVRPYVSTVLSLWIRLFLIAMMLFVCQENLERWSTGIDLPGLGVLASSAYLGPIPVFVLVSLAVALVAALFGWGIETLEAQAMAARRLRPMPPASLPLHFPVDSELPGASILGRNLAGRAPPSPLPA
jgi:hypothetical protein